METVWQDVRYAIRTLLKKPGFTAVAVLSLTLGIGANTTIFTLVKAVFLQSMPVKDAGRVMFIYSTQRSKDGTELPPYMPSSYLNAIDYREKNDVFSGLSVVQFTGASLDIDGKPAGGTGITLVNWDFFDILNVHPLMGRFFSPEEDKTPGARPVVVIGYDMWNGQMGARKDVVGQIIRLNEHDFTIIGVAPRDFRNAGALGTSDTFVPIMMHEQVVTGNVKDWYPRRGFRMVFMVARLKPGVSQQQAQASMHALGVHLAEEHPVENSGRFTNLIPLDQTNVPPAQRGIFVRAGALMSIVVGLVLLIACGNVANLLLARATSRRRELAVRLSLGASRARLIRQLLTESLLIGLAAAGLGLACAAWARDLLAWLLPGGLPDNLDFSLDKRVYFYTLGISIVATMLFGLIPALQATKSEQLSAMKDRSDAPAATGKWYGLRGALVMTQVALSLIALVGSGLFIHSLRNAQQLDPGFEVKHELIVFLPGQQRFPQPQAEQFYRDAVERVRALPTVVAAGISSIAPFNNSVRANVFPEGVDNSDPRNGSLTPMIPVAPGFFSAAGIGLVSGRDFEERDDAGAPKVVVINQTLADLFWKGQNAIGKRVYFHGPDGSDWRPEIVGVVKTVKYSTLGEAPQPLLYAPLKQQFLPNAVLYVRMAGDPGAAIPSVLTALQSIDPKQPLRQGNARTVSERVSNMLIEARVGAELLGGFGSLALILAAMGTYGVMSYSVSQRTHEIGIRMALGAQKRDVLRLVLRNGMAMVVVGVAAGLIASVFLTRSVSSLLYGIENYDLPSFSVTSAILIIVALAACYVPARRAMRVDPMIALRYE
jgi:putative ABC transport system permease protein